MKTFFDRLQLNNITIENRFLVAPMSRVSASQQGIPTPEMFDYYTAFAAGGFGGIITEGLYTDELFSKSYFLQPGIVNTKQVNAWKKITRAIHTQQTVVIAQLMHAGSISQALTSTKGPSSITPLGEKMSSYGGSGPFALAEAMSIQDISEVINGYIQAAQNAYTAGFDGVELHSANGYLLDQFLTPDLNFRTDEYGGSIANRTRITKEIVAGIRMVVPEHFIIGLRISEGKVNNLSYRWEGDSTTAKAVLREIKKMPIDYLHIAAEHYGWQQETIYKDGSSLTGLAKEILDCPIIANGKLHDLSLAQQLLDTEQADLFAIGKMAVANPDFVFKVRNNMPLSPFCNELLHPDPSLFSKHNQHIF